MDLGFNSAVLHYNEGACGIGNVFSYFKIDNGHYIEKDSIKRNKISIREINVKCSEGGKTRINKIRAVKKGLKVIEQENEPSESYITGAFLNVFCFSTTFDFPDICWNIKHDISKIKQAIVLKVSGNLSYFNRSNLS